MQRRRARLAVLLGVLLLVALSGVVGYRVLRGRGAAVALFSKAERLLEAGDREGALIALEQVLRKIPAHARAYLLKGQILLKGRDPATIDRNDAEGINALACFLQATRHDPSLTEGHRVLQTYFDQQGASADAAVHARAVLKASPADLDANRIAAKVYLQEGRVVEATRCVEEIFAREPSVRPSSVLLAARLAELAGRNSPWSERAAQLWQTLDAGHRWPTLDDRMAMVELMIWSAPADPSATAIIDKGLERLESLLSEAADTAAARRLLQSAERIRQRLATRANLPRSAGERLGRFEESVCERALEAGALDAGLYLASARRRAVQQPRVAAELLKKGIERAVVAGPEVRQSFLPCDLWLAEYHLARRQFEAAQDHLDRLDEHPAYRGWGRLFGGYRDLQRGQLETAAAALGEAVERLPEDGAARALLGVCQLRRGRLSEGRRLLEQGIRLGASEPLYQAWLAVALSEAGQLDQAVQVARAALADPAVRGLAHALAGQLQMRAGAYAAAETEFRAALLEADESLRPALRLALAEIAFARSEDAKGDALVRELEETPLAAEALAAAVRQRLRRADKPGAEHLLAEARRRFPDSLPLVVLQVSQLATAGRDDEGARVLREFVSRRPDLLAAHLLLADAEDRKGDSAAAFATLQAARERFAGDPTPTAALVDKLISQRRLAEARELLKTLQEQQQLAPAPLACLAARLALTEGDLEAAETVVRQASRAQPDEPLLKFLEGQLAARSGDYGLAAACFRQSHAAGSFADRSFQLLVESLLRSGAAHEAVNLLASGVPAPSATTLRRRILWLLARQPESAELESQIDRLLQGRPDESDYLIAAAALLTAGQSSKAETVLEAGRKRFPESLALIEQTVLLLLSQDKQTAAEVLLHEAGMRQPESAALVSLRVQLDLRAGRLEAAEATARAQLARGGDDRAFGRLLLEILVRRHRHDEALATAQRLAAKQKRPAEFLLALANAAGGKRSAALEWAASAAQRHPHDGACVHLYFRLLAEHGDTAALEAALSQFLPLRPDDVVLLALQLERAATRADRALVEATLRQVEQAPGGQGYVDYCRGLAAWLREDLAGAERALVAAAALPRTEAPATLALARLRRRQQRTREAIALVENLLRRQRNDLSAQLLLAQLQADTGDFERAESHCRAALAAQPDSPVGRLILARILAQRSDAEARRQSIELAAAALERDQLAADEFAAYLRILLDLGESQRAREASRARQSPAHRLAAARAYLACEDFRAALDLAESVLADQPESFDAAWVRADALLRLAEPQGQRADFAKAADAYRTILRIRPGHRPAANNLAWIVGVYLEQPQRALEELKRVGIAGTELPAELLDTLGVLHRKVGHLSEAQNYLEAALARRPESAVSHYHLGQVYESLGRSARARQSFARAAELDPKGPWTRRPAGAARSEVPTAND